MMLLYVVEQCLRTRQLSASRFGREAANDPRLVFDLRRGRQPRPKTAARLIAYIGKDGGKA